MEPVAVILVCLVVLYFVSELLQFFSVPRVVSQISVGLVLGLPAFAWLFDSESLSVIKFLSSVGAILLMFFVGLEMDFKHFRRDLGASLNISAFNTALPLVLGFLCSYFLFNLPLSVSIIVGVCMSVSATAFALDALEEAGKLKTALGSLIVEAGTVDDIVEIVLVTSILAFIGTVGAKFSFMALLVNVVLFLLLLLLFRLFLIPFVLYVAGHKMYRPALFTGAVIIMLLLAVLADYLKVGAVIGALFAGIIVRVVLASSSNHKPWERIEISRTVHSLGFGFLVPFFFLWVGLNTDLVGLFNNLGFSLTVTVVAIFGTVVGSAFGYWLKARNWQKGWIVGWAMNGKGDTALVITQVAFGAGVISRDIFSSLIFMALVSTLLSPLVFRKLAWR